MLTNGPFFWTPHSQSQPPPQDVSLKPYQMFWGQKSLSSPPLLSWSEQSGEWSFAQTLYTDQADPREVNPGWTRPCHLLCPLWTPGPAPGRVYTGGIPAMPTVVIVPQTHKAVQPSRKGLAMDTRSQEEETWVNTGVGLLQNWPLDSASPTLDTSSQES